MEAEHKLNNPDNNACGFVKGVLICGEPKTFGIEIIDEFNRAYEKRLEFIDKEVGCDCAELKYPIYKDWVRDLIAQNKTFLQVLDELEREATHRFELLETKLQNDTKAFGGDCLFKNLENDLKNDLKNLLELIHRALETNKWDAECLEFRTITVEDIFGKFIKLNETNTLRQCASSSAESEAEMCINELKSEMARLTTELKRKDCLIEDYKGQIKTLRLDYNPSCENTEANTGMEDKFKSCIDELKDIIKDKDEKNLLLIKENENLKKSIYSNTKQNLEPDKQNEFKSITQETKPSEARLKTCYDNSNDLDLEKVENCGRVQSDINICNRLNQEINALLTQIRTRESHICNQNSIICNFQEKLNETRVQLKLITCERDQVCNKLSIIESELEKIKDDIIQCPVSPKSPSNSRDEDISKNVNSDKKSVILHLKPMVNCMRETIVALNRENSTLKSNLEEYKVSLSESKCEKDGLKKQLTVINNKSCADKEVLVKFKCDNKDSSNETLYHDVDDICCSIENIKKRKEKRFQQFKSIFKEFLSQVSV